METQLLTSSKIFTERLFRIPDYQRGYAWTNKQLKDFWNDIEQLEIDRNHYTGVLTLEEVPSSITNKWLEDYWIIDAKSYQAFYIVDGQQRLTTAIVLLQVILEHLEDGNNLNYTSAVDIQRKFIFDSKDNGISRSYIFGYEKDNPSYEFLKTKIFEEHSSTALSEETVYTHNLENAKKFFSERVYKLNHDQLEMLYRKVTQQLLFNIFVISEEVDVCVAFETMNNRGKPLSYLELLKNRLIYLSLKFNEVDFEKQKLRRAVNDCWKSIYHNLGRNKNNPLDDDKFLYNHYIVYFGEEAYKYKYLRHELRYRRQIRVEYASLLLETKFIAKNVSQQASDEERIRLNDIYDYVSSLQNSVECWFKIFNPFDSDYNEDIKLWLDKLNRLGIDYILHIVLVVLQKIVDSNQIIVILKAIERHLFIDSLYNYYGPKQMLIPELKTLQWAIELSKRKITPNKIFRNITEATGRIINKQNFLNEVRSKFRSEGFYKWDLIRFFLFEYNLHLQERSKTKRRKIFWPEFSEHSYDYISVEHIYPKNARNVYWKSRFEGLTPKQRRALRNSLGNLLPLSKPKNSSLSNRPFPEKVDGRSDKVIGYRYGSYAENEVSKETEWTPDQILKRSMKLLSFLEERWDLDLGSEQNKKDMLGIEFIK